MGISYKRIVNGIISALRYIFLTILGIYVVFGLLIFFLPLASSSFCWKHDREIPDKAFIKAVIPSVKSHFAWDTNRIREQLEAAGLSADGEAVNQYRKSTGSFFQGWGDQLPDFNNPDCCSVRRRPTEYSLIHRLLGAQDVVVWIGYPEKQMGGVHFYFDVCGNQWDSDIAAHGISVESGKQKGGS